jgi:hypothetical protein
MSVWSNCSETKNKKQPNILIITFRIKWKKENEIMKVFNDTMKNKISLWAAHYSLSMKTIK